MRDHCGSHHRPRSNSAHPGRTRTPLCRNGIAMQPIASTFVAAEQFSLRRSAPKCGVPVSAHCCRPDAARSGNDRVSIAPWTAVTAEPTISLADVRQLLRSSEEALVMMDGLLRHCTTSKSIWLGMGNGGRLGIPSLPTMTAARGQSVRLCRTRRGSRQPSLTSAVRLRCRATSRMNAAGIEHRNG